MNTTTRRERADTSAGRPGAARARAGVTPSQRAAVIIALLGEAAAKPIVEKLDDVALAKVVTALEHISILAREEQIEIVIDFLTQLRKNSGAMRGGAARAREVMSGIVEPGRLNGLFGGAPAGEAAQTYSPQSGDVWLRVRQREPRQLAEYLGGLTPNIIAMVLRKLDPGAASNILCLLPDDKVSLTLGHMVESSGADAGLDTVIERMIEIEFLNNQEEEAENSGDEYLETIGEVLSLIPDSKRDGLVDFLRTQHETKLPIIQKGLFTIDALPDILPRNSVPVVFKEIDNAVMIKLLASLGDTYAAVSEYLLGNISSRMAESLKDEIKDVPAVAQDVADTLQRDFLTSLMDLKRRGLITMVRAPEKTPETETPA